MSNRGGRNQRGCSGPIWNLLTLLTPFSDLGAGGFQRSVNFLEKCLAVKHRGLDSLDFSSSRMQAQFAFYFIIFLFYKFIYLFLAALGLCCCMWTFSSCGERGLLFVAVRRLLIAVASRCGARALGVWASVFVASGLNSCGARA